MRTPERGHASGSYQDLHPDPLPLDASSHPNMQKSEGLGSGT